MTHRWRDLLAVYLDRRLLTILILGFASGLPLALTTGTLAIRLTEAGVSNTAIGLFALAGTPYSYKFAWAPLMDRLPLPGLSSWLGRRRGWMVATQLALILAILGLGLTQPGLDPWPTALLALVTAFWSASQDIVIDAYRVEILEPRQYGAGAGVVVLGYRLGMLVSGAGALYLATFFDWEVTYALMAAAMAVGVIATLMSPEPAGVPLPVAATGDRLHAVTLWFREAVVAPFADFLRHPAWFAILAFILLYKFGDAMAGLMSNPFYIKLGFTKVEIANVTKVFGMAATIIGGLLGGLVVGRLGMLRSLLVCGVLQMLSNLLFVLLALAGPDIAWLAVVVGVENLSGGMGTAAFVAYLSNLCNVAYTATQYALLSSLAAVGRVFLAAPAGWLADRLDWPVFFVITTLAAVPGLVLLARLRRLSS